MKLESQKELEKQLQKDATNGFKFYIVEGIFRGRPNIAEITGIKKDSGSTEGFSYQSCELRQPQLRRIKNTILKLNIPLKKYEIND